MRYSGLQPQYFPRLHYFARILNADIYVVRDDAQFVSRHKYPDGSKGPSYQVHTPIKQPSGVSLLTVPIVHAGLQPIKDTEVAYGDKWVKNHLTAIQNNYGKASQFKTLMPEIQELLEAQFKTVADLNIATFAWGMLHLLGEDTVTKKMLTIPTVLEKLAKQKEFRLTKIVFGSTLKGFTNPELNTNDKIIAAIKEVGADEDYCGGTAQNAYMDMDEFERQGITIVIQDWKAIEYPQLFTKQQSFLKDLSIIDLLMNTSPKEAIRIIKEGVAV